ncbi:DUF1700 domain-containing protein [Clostridium paraputrificum]|uniref:DUF1700 domain-containing protein n=1 Tax=Clostridium TaxID=1485 RepID=UPI003D3337B3
MTKSEFFRIIEDGLNDFPPSELQDILYDYREHFDNAISVGKSEEEIINELGDPYVIVNQYRSGYIQRVPNAESNHKNEGYQESKYTSNNSTSSNPRKTNGDTANTVLKIAIIIAIAILFGPVGLAGVATVLALLVSLLAIPFSLSVSGIAMMFGKLGFNILGFGVPSFFSDFPSSVIVLVTIASIAATILVIILCVYFIKFLFLITKKIINKISNKGGI